MHDDDEVPSGVQADHAFDDQKARSGESPAGGEGAERRRIRDELVHTALVAGLNDRDAAAFAGCSMRTVRRLRDDPAFRHRISEGRRERLNELSGTFIEVVPRARDTLVASLDAELEGVRVRAADTLLRWAERLHRTTEVDDELVEIKVQLDAVTAALEALADLEGDET